MPDFRIDRDLYIDLLQEKVRALQKAVEYERMSRQAEREMHNAKIARDLRNVASEIRAGAVGQAGMVGVSPAEAADDLAKKEYTPPRNIGGLVPPGQPDRDLMSLTRETLAREDDGC